MKAIMAVFITVLGCVDVLAQAGEPVTNGQSNVSFGSVTVSNMTLVNPLSAIYLSTGGAPLGSFFIAGPGNTVTFGTPNTNLEQIGQWTFTSTTNQGISYLEITNALADFDMRLGSDDSVAFGSDPNNYGTFASSYGCAFIGGIATNAGIAGPNSLAESPLGFHTAFSGGSATGGYSFAVAAGQASGLYSAGIGAVANAAYNDSIVIATGGVVPQTSPDGASVLIYGNTGIYIGDGFCYCHECSYSARHPWKIRICGRRGNELLD